MKSIVLCILDGVGISDKKEGNAFYNANKPNFDKLISEYPHSLLNASGSEVGLPEGQMGNSEVGHMNIGAGSIPYQIQEYINKSIKDGSFFKNKKILETIEFAKKNNSALHLLGLLSDGGVHSHINHLFAILDICKKEKINKLYIHVFTDGRDTDTKSSIKYLDMLKDKLDNIGIGSITTICGRYYAMDRDNRYERAEKAYKAIVNGVGNYYDNYTTAINDSYNKGITDEFIEPIVLDKEGILKDNDALIVFNYRADRLRELFSLISNENNNSIERTLRKNIKLLTMSIVSDEVICENAIILPELSNTLGIYLDKLNLKQLRIAETEKYAHVTYFFDGGREIELKNSKRILIPSPKVATYDMKPEMSAYNITKTLINELDNDYDFVVVNYANPDMVGHTGNYDAAVEAVEKVDLCLGKLYEKVKSTNGVLFILADHGNCENMIDENGNPITTHTTNKVPFIITDKNIELTNGKLADIAPTVLKYMNIKIPDEMNGNILIK